MAVYRVLVERGPMTEPEIRDALGLTRHRHDALAALRKAGAVEVQRRYRKRAPTRATQMHAIYRVVAAAADVPDSVRDVEVALRRLDVAPLEDIVRASGWGKSSVRRALRTLNAVKTWRCRTALWQLP